VVQVLDARLARKVWVWFQVLASSKPPLPSMYCRQSSTWEERLPRVEPRLFARGSWASGPNGNPGARFRGAPGPRVPLGSAGPRQGAPTKGKGFQGGPGFSQGFLVWAPDFGGVPRSGAQRGAPRVWPNPVSFQPFWCWGGFVGARVGPPFLCWGPFFPGGAPKVSGRIWGAPLDTVSGVGPGESPAFAPGGFFGAKLGALAPGLGAPREGVGPPLDCWALRFGPPVAPGQRGWGQRLPGCVLHIFGPPRGFGPLGPVQIPGWGHGGPHGFWGPKGRAKERPPRGDSFSARAWGKTFWRGPFGTGGGPPFLLELSGGSPWGPSGGQIGPGGVITRRQPVSCENTRGTFPLRGFVKEGGTTRGARITKTEGGSLGSPWGGPLLKGEKLLWSLGGRVGPSLGSFPPNARGWEKNPVLAPEIRREGFS